MRDFFLPGRSPVYAPHAACACSHPLATAEALAVLRAGGSAADAAIAAAAVLCVAEPHMTGIGGDCFVLVKTSDTSPLALNGSGWAAAQTNANKLRAAGMSAIDENSALAVTVPGAVAAWKQLHRRYGRLPWRGLFSAAIRYAQNGLPVAPRVAADWRRHAGKLQGAAAAAFLPNGKPPPAGERFALPALARGLQTIADDGGASFYGGGMADSMLAALERAGGTQQKADFAEYAPRWQQPICADFDGWRIWQCPPNGQGVVALLLLQMLKQTPANASAKEKLAAFANATARAYQWRDSQLGEGCDNAAIGEALAAAAAGELPSPPAPPTTAEHKDTVYLSVIDGRGLAVSFINSLFAPFGSGLFAPEYGILLHCRGASFSLTPGHANELRPRARPMHTIIPAIGEGANGETLSFGVMGGHYQAAGQAWFLWRWLREGDDLQQALDAPRFFNYPDALWAEPTLPQEWQSALAAAGHPPRLCEEPLGGGQAVLRLADGTLVAASDPRKDGMAAGF